MGVALWNSARVAAGTEVRAFHFQNPALELAQPLGHRNTRLHTHTVTRMHHIDHTANHSNI